MLAESDHEKARNYWNNIEQDWSLEVYAWAQLYLGNLAYANHQPEDAHRYWASIQEEWSEECFAKAQAQLQK